MNIRSKTILTAFAQLDAQFPDEPVNIVEIGCMFWKGEGISTYLGAKFIAERKAGGKMVSIDIDPAHFTACKQMIDGMKPGLNDKIDYRLGDSLKLLPGILQELGSVHCFLQDGAAHPLTCLIEFELAVKKLVPGGIIVVDDLQPIPPSEVYPGQRIFGKAALTLPILVLSSFICLYKQGVVPDPQKDENGKRLESEWLKGLEGASFPNIGGYSYSVIGREQKLLLFGRKEFVAKATEVVTDYAERHAFADALMTRLRSTSIWQAIAKLKNVILKG